MTEKAETPKILDEISKSNSAKAGNRTSRKQQKARRRFIIVILILLPIVAGVLFLAYQQLSLQSQLLQFELENKELTDNLEQQSALLRQLEQVQQQVPEAVAVDDSTVRELESALLQKIDQLTMQLADLQTQQLQLANNEANQEWKVLEAEYLIGIAAQKLQLEGDIATAIAQLQHADQALLDSGGSNVFAVRQAIASELQQLRNVEVLDREGIYLQLGGLIVEIENIDLLSSMQAEFENRRNAESQPLRLGADANNTLDSTLEFLGSIFVLRKWEETPQAILEPGQDELIKQSLRLMLEQAQLALLMRDNGLYQQAIAKSRDWFQRYAVTDSEQGRALSASLEQLGGYDIDPVLPVLTQSLSLINQLTTSEH